MSKPQFCFDRKIITAGNALAISIPVEAVSAMKLEKGLKLHITIEKA